MAELIDPDDQKLDGVELDYLRAIRQASRAGDNDLANYFATGLKEYRESFKGLK